jgi:hypothetical protein
MKSELYEEIKQLKSQQRQLKDETQVCISAIRRLLRVYAPIDQYDGDKFYGTHCSACGRWLRKGDTGSEPASYASLLTGYTALAPHSHTIDCPYANAEALVANLELRNSNA